MSSGGQSADRAKRHGAEQPVSDAERDRLLQELKESYERINRILDSITDAFFSLDHNWRFTHLNHEALRLLRKSETELLGANVWQEFPGADAFRHRCDQVTTGNKAVHFEEYYAPLATWFEVHAYPTGEGINVYFRDINDRKQAEQALRDSEADLKHAQAVAHTGSWRLNVHRNELYWSDETYRLFGIAKGTAMTYETFLAAVHPEDRALVDRNWQAALGGAVYDLEHRIVVGDEVKWVREKAELEFDEQGALLGGFGAVQDITERKRAEEAVMRAEKLASVARMAATLAHEINDPLAAAINLLYLGSRDPGLSQPTRTFLATAEQELRRAAQIARRTLGLYREPNARARVAIAELVAELAAIYQPRLRARGLQLQVRVADRSTAVFGNAGELRQLLSNLLVNSIDALADSGTVYVRVGKPSRLSGAPRVRVTVADTGKGIEPQDMDRIFEPFFTTKKDTGTGLGLWISEQIVRKQGGAMRVRSRVGRGTVFSILLPAAAPSAAAASAR